MTPSDLEVVVTIGRSLTQLMLLSGGAILCVLTVAIVFRLLGGDHE